MPNYWHDVSNLWRICGCRMLLTRCDIAEFCSSLIWFVFKRNLEIIHSATFLVINEQRNARSNHCGYWGGFFCQEYISRFKVVIFSHLVLKIIYRFFSICISMLFNIFQALSRWISSPVFPATEIIACIVFSLSPEFLSSIISFTVANLMGLISLP